MGWSMFKRFTDNDTKNCPILQGTVKIEKVVDNSTGEEVSANLWMRLFRVQADFLQVINVRTLMQEWRIYISAANKLRRGGNEEWLVRNNVYMYPNKPPYF